MQSLLIWAILASALIVTTWADPKAKPDVAHLPGYGNNQYQQSRDPGAPCTQCRANQHCTSELDIRDSEVPKEVPVPSVDYQIVYKDKQVQVVTDYEIRENLCPVPVQLQDTQVRAEPVVRNIDKVVIVRVPRITENVVIKRVDRVKLVTEYRTKPKRVKVQHTRQVPDPVTVPLRKDVVRKKLVADTTIVPVPVRVANQVDIDVVHIDKPVTVPSVNFKFCENIQEIKVKGDCPTVKQAKIDTYLPPQSPATEAPRYVQGYEQNHRQSAGWTPHSVYRRIRSLFQ